MLIRGVDAAPRLRQMVSGFVIGTTILVIIFHGFDPLRMVAAWKGYADAAFVNRVVDLCTGVVLMLAAVAVVLSKHRGPIRHTQAPKAPAGSFSYFLLGLVVCVGIGKLPLAYLTGRLISGTGTNPVVWVLAYAIFLVALGAPFFTLAWSRVPKLVTRITGFYSRARIWDYCGLLAIIRGTVGLAIVAPRGQ